MNSLAPLLFVRVDAIPRPDESIAGSPSAVTPIDSPAHLTGSRQQFLTVVIGENPAVMLVQSAEAGQIDSELERWLMATATRLVELRKRYSGLTRRERDTFPLITDGLLNKQAASVLGISQSTLQIYRGRIMQKMAARSFAELVRMADALGLSGAGGGRGSAWGSLRPTVAASAQNVAA